MHQWCEGVREEGERVLGGGRPGMEVCFGTEDAAVWLGIRAAGSKEFEQDRQEITASSHVFAIESPQDHMTMSMYQTTRL